jgi:hypothetical protein
MHKMKFETEAEEHRLSYLIARFSPAMQQNDGRILGVQFRLPGSEARLGMGLGAARNILLGPYERYDMSAFGFGRIETKAENRCDTLGQSPGHTDVIQYIFLPPASQI